MLIRGDFSIISGSIKPSEAFKKEFIKNGCSIYEVLRVIKGKPVFITEHLNRLVQSARLTGCKAPSNSELKQNITQLIEVNHIFNGNIEILVNSNKAWSVRFIPHHWPTPDKYKFGVKTMLYQALRENPNAKVKLMDLRMAVGEFIRENNLYEAIYVNDGYISEGSKSNIFFVSGQKFVTAPEAQVLPGITRKIVLEILQKQNYDIEFRKVHVNELNTFNSAFITGTSPGVLPIAQINNYNYDVNQTDMRNIMTLFESRMFTD